MIRRVALTLLRPVFWAAALALDGLLRLLEPVLLVRLGYLEHDRIGHLAANTEMHLRSRAARPESRRAVDLFISGPPVNRPLFELVRRRTVVLRAPLLGAFFRNALAPRLAGTPRFIDLSWDDLDYASFQRTQPQLRLEKGEKDRGRALLAELGIPEGARFVCFHSRDGAYLKARDGSKDWSYHDFRDCRVENYLPAATKLAERGLYALRMGQVVEAPITPAHPRVIDYASTHRSEFGDLFLSAACKFFLGNTAGLLYLPIALGVPVAQANVIPIACRRPAGPSDVWLPKLLRERSSGRLLGFGEIAKLGGGWTDSALYAKAGLEPVENGADEIVELALELDDRLDGRWTPRPGDDELQELFWSRFPETVVGCRYRVGAAFLRRHQELLS